MNGFIEGPPREPSEAGRVGRGAAAERVSSHACAGTNEYDILTTIGEGGEKTIFNADFITAGNCYILRLEESQATPFRVRRLVLFPIGL